MSRTNQLTQATSVLKELKDLQVLKDPSSLSITTFNININFSSPTTSSSSSDEHQKTLTKICTLIGHQLDESREERMQREERRSRRAISREAPRLSAEMDKTQEEAVETEENLLSIAPAVPKSKLSAEYQDLSRIHSALTDSRPRRTKYRVVPTKELQAIPEDQLPKKKFADNIRGRREYVKLCDLNVVENTEPVNPEVRVERRKNKKMESGIDLI